MIDCLRHNWLIHSANWAVVARHANRCHGDLLDIGCGDKPYERLLLPHVERYIGLEHPATIHRKDRVDVWGDAAHLPFAANTFDTVCAFHLLEHTETPDRVIAEAHRVLRPGGTVLLSVPFLWGIHEAPRDFYRFTPFGLEYLLRSNGFVGVIVEPLGGFWMTAGLRFSYHLQRFARGPAIPILRIVQCAAQVLVLALDRLDLNETDAPGYIAVARRPASAEAGGDRQ
jgi:SAM-dependent methyltransferase